MLIENSNIHLDKQAKKRDNKIEIDPHQELEVGDYVLQYLAIKTERNRRSINFEVSLHR